MKGMFEKVKKVDRFGIIRGLVVFCIITVSVFFLIRHNTYKQTLSYYQGTLSNQTNITTSQLDETMQNNLQYLYNAANIIGEYSSFRSEEAIQRLFGLEDGSIFSELYILYNDGTLIDCEGQEVQAESTLVSGIFQEAAGFTIIQDPGDVSGALLYVPIVEGKSQLLGTIDISYLNKKVSMFASPEVSRIMLVSADSGDIMLHVAGHGAILSDTPENFFDIMMEATYLDDRSFTDIKRDIQKELSGDVSFYSQFSNENQHASYAPIGYGDWFLVLVMPDTIVELATSKAQKDILYILVGLIFIYMLILLFSIYLNRRSDKENEEIRMQVQVAELANEAKTSFLSNMSHDIRTPLNAIVGLADICEMNVDNPQRVKECLDKQKAASEHLMTLINDVLEMSRIESGKVIFDDNEFNLGTQIHGLVLLVQQRMYQKNLKLNVSIENLIHEDVFGDEQRLNRVMMNILSNAVKFTGMGGNVSIVLNEIPLDERGYSEFEYKVTDTGIGMTEEFIKKIFIPFERMHDSTVSQIEGAGLGMTIAHDLLQKMGGSIDVQSRLGEGTVVSIRVRMKVKDIHCEEGKNRELLEKYHDKYVVVVDNDVTLVEWMDRLVHSLGLRCIATTSGREAIDKVEQMYQNKETVSLMIFGWKMPKIDGVELSRRMRSIVGNEVPIILQSVYEFGEHDKDIRTAGINSVLTEPVFKSDLLAILDEMTFGGIDSKMTFPDFTGRRILLVEDHRVNAEIVAEYLKYTGIDVDIVYDGSEAVEKIQTTPDEFYDLILMDIRMPRLNGYDATRKIRAMRSEYTREIPIIALSANAFVEDRKMSKEVGMNGHLAKPVKYDEVYAELKKWFK